MRDVEMQSHKLLTKQNNEINVLQTFMLFISKIFT